MMPQSGRIRSWLLWASALGLATALVAFDSSRGPLLIAAPRTVFSNGHPGQLLLERYLLFLRDIRSQLPVGATVLVLLAPGTPNPAPNNLAPFFYVALGQLPDQRVLSPQQEYRGLEEAGFLACYGGECPQQGFREAQRFPGGTLYRRVP